MSVQSPAAAMNSAVLLQSSLPLMKISAFGGSAEFAISVGVWKMPCLFTGLSPSSIFGILSLHQLPDVLIFD